MISGRTFAARRAWRSERSMVTMRWEDGWMGMRMRMRMRMRMKKMM